MVQFNLPFITLLASILAGVSEAAPVEHDNHESVEATVKIPSVYESAVIARKILLASSSAHFGTVYPDDTSLKYIPKGANGKPTVFPHLIADCSKDGTPSVIVFPIATTWRNAKAHGGDIAVSVEAEDWSVEKGRLTLLGKVVESKFESEEEEEELRACFIEKNPNAKWWLPKRGQNGVHSSRFGKVEVETVAWVGGFGGVARIGELDLDVYKSIDRAEVEKQLKGEQAIRFREQSGRDTL